MQMHAERKVRRICSKGNERMCHLIVRHFHRSMAMAGVIDVECNACIRIVFVRRSDLELIRDASENIFKFD